MFIVFSFFIIFSFLFKYVLYLYNLTCSAKTYEFFNLNTCAKLYESRTYPDAIIPRLAGNIQHLLVLDNNLTVIRSCTVDIVLGVEVLFQRSSYVSLRSTARSVC